MMKLYATPTVIKNGDVVHETLSDKPGGSEVSATIGPPNAGRLGFNL
jgi:hypothetical protein